MRQGIDCRNRAYKETKIGKAIDISNKKFERLTALCRVKIIGKEKIKDVYWLTQCDCGNLICATTAHLKSGHTRSCGCLQKEGISKLGEKSRKNLTNIQHNGITFLNLNTTYKKEHYIKSKNAYWNCKCFCGKIFVANSGEILQNRVVSCGCLGTRKSSGEVTIENILKNNNIKYIYDSSYFDDLIMPTGIKGRYDFILLDENNKPYRLIEFDGIQHYNQNKYFDKTENDYLKRKRHDEIKNQYALQNNIPLIRIPYTELNSLSLDLLLSDKYLISK